MHSSTPMTAALATCAVLLVTATGCGSRVEEGQSPSSASDSPSSASESPSSASESPSSASESPSPSESPSETPQTGTSLSRRTLIVGDTVEAGQAIVVSASNVDGPTTPLASPLNDDQAVNTFVASLDARLGSEVRAALEEVQVQGDSVLYGSVVAVGCDTPVAVVWKETPEGVETTAEMPKSTVQCLVPVTSVAIFVIYYR